MSKYLKRYIKIFNELQKDDISDEKRERYEEEIEEIYFELDDEDLAYIAENELEM